jgi:hypothetical protein
VLPEQAEGDAMAPLLAGAPECARTPDGTAAAWWLAAPAYQQAIEQHGSALQAEARFQLGDAVLQVAVDDPRLLDTFVEVYGDCAVPSDGPAARVRCTVRRIPDPPLVLLTFQKGAPADPAGAAYNLLRSTLAEPPYSAHDSPLAGWRLAGGLETPVVAARGAHVLIARTQVPPYFLVEYLVGSTLALQPELMAIHGASLQIEDAGVVIVGATHSGKTTTALHLAARGHPLLGDELALLRLASRELLPFRRTVNLRPGPRAPELASLVARLDAPAGLAVSDRWVGPHRISELFPDAPAASVGLRAVFFLNGFAARPALAPFELSLRDEDIVEWLAHPAIAYCSWGLAPERRALRLLALRQVLKRVPCWLLEAGSPLATAELIERTVEGLAC